MAKRGKVIPFPPVRDRRGLSGAGTPSRGTVVPINIKDIDHLYVDVAARSYVARMEPEDFVTNHEVFLLIAAEEDREDLDREIGYAFAYAVEGGLAARYGESLAEIMDAHSQALAELYPCLFDGRGRPREWLAEAGIRAPDILFLDYVCLMPEYRGRGLGRAVLMGVIEALGRGADVVVTEPRPLRFAEESFNEKLQLPELDEKEAAGVARRLDRYLRGMGFLPLPGDEGYLYLPLSSGGPTAADYLARLR